MMKAIIHAINDDNVPGLQHLLGSLNNYDVNQPNKVTYRHVQLVPAESDESEATTQKDLCQCPDSSTQRLTVCVWSCGCADSIFL